MLDIPLLRFQNFEDEERPILRILISQDDASVFCGTMPFIPALVYITTAMRGAKFKELSTQEFKNNYLAPLDSSIKESKHNLFPFLDSYYDSPRGYTWNNKLEIKQYFHGNIAGTIDRLYYAIFGDCHHFGSSPVIKTILNEKQRLRTDAMHYKMNYSTYNPEICFALGTYKSENYYLYRGFKELKSAMENVNGPIECIFPGREWSPRIFSTLTLRRFIYHAFHCGTDRVFISYHQSFSGFFKYEIIDSQMEIDYYIITDAETVLEGVTLRSAIAGFFFKTEEEALNTRKTLAKIFQVACSSKGFDPLLNILPRPVELLGKLSPIELQELEIIEEMVGLNDFEIISHEPYWRIIHDAVKWYPSYEPSIHCGVKLYYYSKLFSEDQENDLSWVSIPDKREYYEMFVNEFAINKILAESKFASNFPKLIQPPLERPIHP